MSNFDLLEHRLEISGIITKCIMESKHCSELEKQEMKDEKVRMQRLDWLTSVLGGNNLSEHTKTPDQKDKKLYELL